MQTINETQELHQTQMIIANNVIKLRKAQNWSQADLALKTGMNISYIASLESGKRSLSLLNLLKLAKVFGVKVEELVI